MAKTVVPFRNGVMLAVAASVAESELANSIAIGSHSGDHHIYPDCRPMFNSAMATAVLSGTSNGVQLLRPFEDMTKAEIVRVGQRLNAPLALTWSCYKGGEKHCGRCGTCVERAEAFAATQGADPTDYADSTFWKQAVEAHHNGTALRRGASRQS
jgi:7-cyano-7-deazaguanine synthase